MSLLQEIFTIIAPVFICASVGFCWVRLGMALDSDFITRLIMWVTAPCLIVYTLSRVEVTMDALGQMSVAVIAILVITSVSSLAIRRWLSMAPGDYMPSLLFPNVGNMGLPLSLFAFGEQGLVLALVVFMMITLANFTIGVGLLSGGSPLYAAARAPIVYASLLAVILLITGWPLPAWTEATLAMLGDTTVPLMLLALGAALGNIRTRIPVDAFKLGTLRLILGFSGGWLVAHALGLTGMARGVLLIQSTMPIAIFNYLLAARFQRSPDVVAGAVLVSTVLSFLTLPLLLWYVLPGE